MRWSGTTALASLALAVGTAAAQTKPRPAPRAQQLFNVGLLEVNRVQCVVSNIGELCSDVGEVQAAGLWPKHTPDQYIFKSGIQIAGMIPAS